ncbi:hypothetical protein ABZ626_22725 [Streptomyces longispororuber]|uniref:hypothetical protein n=1 Tax=Streptomyces longispororuber TaxID=68230 RepID=UPI0033FB98D5
MALTDVRVELHSQALGVRMVRADTITQVRWDAAQSADLTIGLNGGQEVRWDVWAEFPTDGIEKDEAADLCTPLIERNAEAADKRPLRPGPPVGGRASVFTVEP